MYYSRTMRTISLRLRDDLADDLEKAAQARGVTKTSLICESLQQTLHAQSGPRATAYDLSRDLIFKRGRAPKDLATNPRYMNGFGK